MELTLEKLLSRPNNFVAKINCIRVVGKTSNFVIFSSIL